MSEASSLDEPTGDDRFPTRIFGIASPMSLCGSSMLQAGLEVRAETVGGYMSEGWVVQRAAAMLHAAGFEVLHISALMISIAGSRQNYEGAFGIKLVSTAVPTRKEAKRIEDAIVIHVEGDPTGRIGTLGTQFEGVLEDVAIEVPRYLMTPSGRAPAASAEFLRLPDDLALVLNAEKAHRAGCTGAGVRVAVVDSGFYPHPYFAERGYRIDTVVLGPGAEDADADELGHGTGMVANVLALAPDAEIIPVKVARAGRAGLVNAVGALNAALDLAPDVISCSWGSDLEEPPLWAADHALAAAISAAVAGGKVVVVPAGNGHWSFPGQHPEVISAGGAFPAGDGTWAASSYASGFISKIYGGRRVPDVCGAVGQAPDAALLVLPTEPGSLIDREHSPRKAAGPKPATDGWGAYSGTSAAAAQIAGAAAVLRQAYPQFHAFQLRDVLAKSALDVTSGKGHERFGQEATPGVDLATGPGVVDVTGAVLLAALWNVDPLSRPTINPTYSAPFLPFQANLTSIPIPEAQAMFPFQPFQPFRPVRPLVPFQPPFRPVLPLVPFQPFQPFRPVLPLQPFRPVLPLQPFRPVLPLQPFRPPFQPPFLPPPFGGLPDPGQLAAQPQAQSEAQQRAAFEQAMWEAQQQAAWAQAQWEAQQRAAFEQTMWEAQQQATWAQAQWEAQQQQAAWEQAQWEAQQQQQAAWQSQQQPPFEPPFTGGA